MEDKLSRMERYFKDNSADNWKAFESEERKRAKETKATSSRSRRFTVSPDQTGLAAAPTELLISTAGTMLYFGKILFVDLESHLSRIHFTLVIPAWNSFLCIQSSAFNDTFFVVELRVASCQLNTSRSCPEVHATFPASQSSDALF